jgi:Fis family transcriptional regulator, factor for inversion stimulation protein
MSDHTVREPQRLKERLESICREMIDRGILFAEAAGQFERLFIAEIVRRNGGNILRSAEQLGLHRNTLSKRLSGNLERSRD